MKPWITQRFQVGRNWRVAPTNHGLVVIQKLGKKSFRKGAIISMLARRLPLRGEPLKGSEARERREADVLQQGFLGRPSLGPGTYTKGTLPPISAEAKSILDQVRDTAQRFAREDADKLNDSARKTQAHTDIDRALVSPKDVGQRLVDLT